MITQTITHAHPDQLPVEHQSGWLRTGLLLSCLVLAVSLAVTYRFWKFEQQGVLRQIQTRFDSRVSEAVADVEYRMKLYEQVLRGVDGLFVHADNVERGEFHDYAERLQLKENYPGIQGVGYALIIPQSQKEKHIAAMRKQGFHDYTIKPEGEREIYTSVIYLEPFSGPNLNAFGYDMYSDLAHPRDGDAAPGVRRAAMEQARDSGKVTLSGKARLLMETDKNIQAGILMYLPVYKKGRAHDTLAERRANIIGWAYAPFRMGDLMNNILRGYTSELDIEIYTNKEMSDSALLYRSKEGHGSGKPRDALFKTSKYIEIGGHGWTMTFRSLPGFEAEFDNREAQIIAYTGIGISLLLTLLTWLLISGRERAQLAARKMNKELIGSEERAKRISLFYKMLSDMDSANIHIRERGQVFDTACRIALESGLFRMVWIGLLDRESGDVVPVAQAGHVDGYLDNLAINIYDADRSTGPVGMAIRLGEHVVCKDISHDPIMEPWRKEALKNGYRASVDFPLAQSGTVIGTFSFYFSDAGLLSDDVIQVLDGLAKDISFALDFIAESQQRERVQGELLDLTMHLQTALENERKHIARELHDELGQTMTALSFDLKWLDENIKVQESGIHTKLNSMKDLVSRTVDSIRRISEDLRPGMLDDLGLAAAIEHHVVKFSEQSGIECSLFMNATDYELDEQVATALFRIVQESLTNVARHSGANHVTIRLQELEDKILLIVQDNGSGLPLDQVAGKKTYGLMGMRERVKMIGGTLDVFNEAGAGARIEACVSKHLKR